MTGSRAQLYNGSLLLFSFASCRLVYGTYQSVRVFGDIWAAVNSHPSTGPKDSAVMAFVTPESTVPLWLATLYLASNLTLNSLNFYWFVMMIRAVRKRFEPGVQAPNRTLTGANVEIRSATSGASLRRVKQRRKA